MPGSGDEREEERQRTENALQALSDLVMDGSAKGLLRAQSRWALETAALAALTNGIGGSLTLRLPSKPTDHIEFTYVTGEADVVSRPMGGRR